MADLTYAQALALIGSDPAKAFAMLLSGNQPDGTAIDSVGTPGLPASPGQKAASASLSVVAASAGYSSGLVTVTRPANTNTYGAGDVVGATAAAITFPNMGPAAGGPIMITSSVFRRDVAALISGETSYTLHLYSVTPPSALADEATWDLPAGDRASYLGSINLGTPVDLGSTLYVAQDGINKQVTLASSNLFGYLVTVGSYVAASATVHAISLSSVGL